MRKIKIKKYTHQNHFTLIGFMTIENNKVDYYYTNQLIVVKYQKEHLPLKYK